jgi:hypothetical protein
MAVPSQRDPDFEARWATWVARGVAHDRQVRRRLSFAMPLAIVAVVVALAFMWFTR